MTKKKNDLSSLTRFPYMFFLLGLITQLFMDIFDNWVTWLIISAGIELYFLLYMWFLYELSREDR